MTIHELVDELLALNIITPSNVQIINPNAERMLIKRERYDLIDLINHYTSFIDNLSEVKLKDKIRSIYRDRFETVDDVPICKNDGCNNQVLIFAGAYKTLSEYCSLRCSNVHKSVLMTSTIDPETGLTLAKLNSIKMRETLENTIDPETGLTLEILRRLATSKGCLKVQPCGRTTAEIRAQEEAKRRHETITDDGRTLHQVYGERSYLVNKSRDNFRKIGDKLKEFYQTEDGKKARMEQGRKHRETLLRKRSSYDFSDPDVKRMYRIYKRRVMYFTRQHIGLLENHEKRGSHATDPDAYHVDHIYPVSLGFEYSIPPFIMGSVHNLQMLPWRENIKKGAAVVMDKEELFDKFFSVNNNPTISDRTQ